ncbi:MAG: hypothetical protein WBL50_18400 [Candidatus Acidiferrum sp.]
MSEKAQINIQQGNKVIRIFSGWGIPRNIRPALRAAASAEHTSLIDIAREIIRQVPDASYGLRVIGKDYEHQDDLSYRYTVDVSETPWRVRQTKMPGHKLTDNGDGTASIDPNLTPAITRSYRIAQQ